MVQSSTQTEMLSMVLEALILVVLGLRVESESQEEMAPNSQASHCGKHREGRQ